MAGKFEAQVAAWVKKSKALEEAVFRESVQRLVDLAQKPVAKGGNLPVKTGFLRASGRMTKDGSLPSITSAERDPERSYSWEGGDISLILASASISDTITFAYTANYARYVEHRSKFVGLAAQRWQQIVSEVCSEVKGRA